MPDLGRIMPVSTALHVKKSALVAMVDMNVIHFLAMSDPS